MHRREFKLQRNKKEWATAYFWFSIATENSSSLSQQRVLVTTGSLGRAHDMAWARAAGMRPAGRACDRASWLYVVTRSFCVATRSPGMLGGLGSDREAT